MNPLTPFNNWIMSKIASYLASKEGCQVEQPEYTPDGARFVLQDVFGFRYELRIKTISRINNDIKGLDKYAKTSQSNYLVTYENQAQLSQEAKK